MAILIKSDVTVADLAQLFGIGPSSSVFEKVNDLIAMGVEVKCAPMSIAFVNKSGMVLGKAPIKLDSLKLVQQHKLAPNSVEILRVSLIKAIETAHKSLKLSSMYGAGSSEHVKWDDVDTQKGKNMDYDAFFEQADKLKDEKAPSVVETFAPLKKSPNHPMFVEHPNTKKTDSVEYAELTDAKVSLTAATKLHQPVLGTNDDSKYYCIALHDDFNVAVRIKSDKTVSIRAEGEPDKISKYDTNMHQAGLAVGSPKHYSIHLNVSDGVTACKCIGAVLFAMGIQFKGITTRVGKLVGV